MISQRRLASSEFSPGAVAAGAGFEGSTP